MTTKNATHDVTTDTGSFLFYVFKFLLKAFIGGLCIFAGSYAYKAYLAKLPVAHYSFEIPLERIFMHNYGSYSALTKVDGKLEVIQIQEKFLIPNTSEIFSQEYSLEDQRKMSIIDDAPADKKPFLELKYSRRKGKIFNVEVFNLHIHSVQEINGAGWEEATKFRTKHNTTVIE